MNLCVLSDTFLREWQVRALEGVLSETDVEISLVVVNYQQREGALGDSDEVKRAIDCASNLALSDIRLFFDVLRSKGAWAFVLAEWKIGCLIQGNDMALDKRRRIEDVELFSDVEIRRCTPITGDSWNELPDDVVDYVADRADVVIRFGFGLVRGRILEAPEHGVLSIHPADVRKYRGIGYPRAFLNGESTLGVTIQQLSETIDGGKVVAIGTTDIADAYTLDDVHTRANELKIELLPRAINNLHRCDFEPEVPDTLGEYMPLRNRRRLGFAGRIVLRDVIGRFRKIFVGV